MPTTTENTLYDVWLRDAAVPVVPGFPCYTEVLEDELGEGPTNMHKVVRDLAGPSRKLISLSDTPGPPSLLGRPWAS